MSIRVSVNSVPKTRVSINNQQRETIRSVGIVAPTVESVQNLADLNDVNASSPDNNDVLVYDSASNKYVIKELPILNGGTF